MINQFEKKYIERTASELAVSSLNPEIYTLAQCITSLLSIIEEQQKRIDKLGQMSDPRFNS